MHSMTTRRISSWAFVFVAALSVWMIAAEPVAAQIGATPKGRTRGGRDKGPKQARPKRSMAWSDVGSHRSKILKFELAEAGEDEELIGKLKIMPLELHAKAVTLLVRRSDDLKIELGGHVFDPAEFEDIPWKGLICNVTWGYPEQDEDDPAGRDDPKPRKPKKKRELKALRFETMQVKGKIKEIDGDLIILRARPANGQPWPMIKKPSDKPPKETKKKIPLKKLKLKIYEDVTDFVDRNEQPLDFGDFEEGQEIEATVVVGKMGIMVTLAAPDIESDEGFDEPEDRPKRKPRGRPRPRRGPRP
jgi:hypothetical protein